MFLPKDPVAARDVLRDTSSEKMNRWLVLLKGIVNNDDVALEAQCFMDDVPTFEELREAASASIVQIEAYLLLSGGPGAGFDPPLTITPVP